MIVEDGTGLPTADSYASTEAADEYFEARGITAWTGTDDPKEHALVIATGFIDGLYGGKWRGWRRTAGQTLAWPRSAVRDDDGYVVDDELLPQALVHATFEAALLVRTGVELSPNLERGGRVTSERVQVGPISEAKTYAGSAPGRITFTRIEDLLRGLTVGSGVSRRIERA